MQPRRELFAVLSIACSRACVWVEGVESVSVPSEEGVASSVGAGRVEANLTNSWRVYIKFVVCVRRTEDNSHISSMTLIIHQC